MLWTIGNLVLLLVVVPVAVALLNRVLAALEDIRGAADITLDAPRIQVQVRRHGQHSRPRRPPPPPSSCKPCRPRWPPGAT